MEQFVCVRVVQANSLDLSLFQFDYDLTLAVFLMNADKTIYGRYGSRSSHDEPDQDISMEGFREALEGALELHRDYPENRRKLSGKQGSIPRFRVPEEFPALRGKYRSELEYSGNVARSCMHCHQLRDAERLLFRSGRKPIPDEVLYPYPMPDVVGMTLDPKTRATISAVSANSAAGRAGFRVGDRITALDGQSVLSIADVQWILHHAPDTAALQAEFERDGRSLAATLQLAAGWRRASDISWRPTTWDLRRMGSGGLVLEQLPAEERSRAGLSASDLALRVTHVGEYGEHAVGKRAGFLNGDVLIAVDGQTRPMRETDLLAYAVQKKLPGDQLPVTVLRAGKRLELRLLLQ
jgi:hypothetical protein